MRGLQKVGAEMSLTVLTYNIKRVVNILGMLVSGNYFDVLGARPSRGRFFLPEEDQTPGTHPVAVVSSA